MIATLALVGVENLHIDLGHIGVFRGLTVGVGLTAEKESELFDALQRKARVDVESLLASRNNFV